MKKRLYGVIESLKHIKSPWRLKTLCNNVVVALAVVCGVSAILYNSKMPEIIEVVKADTLITVTGYNPGIESQTDDTPCIGASNLDLCRLVKYHIPVCASNDYPLGTKIEIEGYGDCYVLDRMNSRFKNRIDIAFEKLEDAKEWGIKKLNVYGN